ncbi:hypothetical protein [Deinococcus hohokamensis]|uniref:Flp pilus-assembly TadG-like N-terminal domain-containing protein n=1 Tax=Deinococcus hohokamensis TaxID=309883 RepID=A0ABV9I9X0_9DEIO
MEIVLLLAALTLLVLMFTFLSLTADDRALARDLSEARTSTASVMGYAATGHD